MNVIDDVLQLWWLDGPTVDVSTQSRVSVDWSGRLSFIAIFFSPSPSSRGDVARELSLLCRFLCLCGNDQVRDEEKRIPVCTATSSVLGYLQEGRWSSVAFTEDLCCPCKISFPTCPGGSARSQFMMETMGTRWYAAEIGSIMTLP